MRYNIYGDDLLDIPYIRNLTLTDDMGVLDILEIIGKFWNSANSFYHDRGNKEGEKKPALTLGSDKNGCLTLFSRFSYDGASLPTLRRVGVLVPESHPLFNFTLLYVRINRFVRSGPVSEINIPYFLKQIENFSYDNI